jgi:hypothetical protein
VAAKAGGSHNGNCLKKVAEKGHLGPPSKNS